jgi:hypothetical protein
MYGSKLEFNQFLDGFPSGFPSGKRGFRCEREGLLSSRSETLLAGSLASVRDLLELQFIQRWDSNRYRVRLSTCLTISTLAAKKS